MNSTRLPGGSMLFSRGTGKADRARPATRVKEHEVGPGGASARLTSF